MSNNLLYDYLDRLNIDVINLIIDYSRPNIYDEISKYVELIKNDEIEYNRWIRYSKYVKFKDYGLNWAGGYLLDLMSTGCTLPFGRGSKECFDKYFRDDLDYILKNYDNCLNYPYGSLRCRDGLSPLSMATINITVPISIISLLLKNGANVDEFYNLNGSKIKLLTDIKFLYGEDLNVKRIAEIEKIFRDHIKKIDYI